MSKIILLSTEQLKALVATNENAVAELRETIVGMLSEAMKDEAIPVPTFSLQRFNMRNPTAVDAEARQAFSERLQSLAEDGKNEVVLLIAAPELVATVGAEKNAAQKLPVEVVQAHGELSAALRQSVQALLDSPPPVVAAETPPPMAPGEQVQHDDKGAIVGIQGVSSSHVNRLPAYLSTISDDDRTYRELLRKDRNLREQFSKGTFRDN